MKKKNKIKILVIGGTGFIGYHILKKAIKKNWSAESFSTKKPKKIRLLPKVKYWTGNTCDSKSLKVIDNNYDYIINASGYVDHSNKKKVIESHYEACKKIIRPFLVKRPKLFIQIGSSLEYGKQTSPHRETYRAAPLSTYGKAKYKATKFFLKMSKKNNFPVTILRPYQVYGPAQDINRLIPTVINSCLKDRSFPCSIGNQIRNFIYIDDFINLIFKCLLSEKAKGKIINVGYRKSIQVKKVINIIQKKIKKGKPKFGLVKLRKEEDLVIFPSIDLAFNLFKWSPKISFTKGINKTIFFFRKNLKKNI